jgi:radical SAM superfamily enzyme YgiQ (UPF0313 family)
VYDHVLKETNRGHTLDDTKKSLQILKDLGFKINAHLMPGLPGVNYDEDLAGLKEIFANADYRPDLLKIYPCQVSQGTALYYKWKKAFLEGGLNGLKGNGKAGAQESALKKENEELKALIGELTVENRFLKRIQGS